MLKFITNMFSSRAAAEDVKIGALPSKQVAVGTYAGTAKGQVIGNYNNNLTNIDLALDSRSARSLNEVIKKLVKASPDLSSAVATKISTTITNSYTAIAYNDVGQVDDRATVMLQGFVRKLDFLSYSYTGFRNPTDLRSVSSSLLLDLIRYGGMMSELVLGKGRIPSHIKVVPYRLIEWAVGADGDVYPVYNPGRGGKIDLNYPTIFHSVSAQDSETAYADSSLTAAIQICLWDMEFVNALRSAATKNLLQRLKIVINSEKFLNTLPSDVRTDSGKLEQYMDALIAKLQFQVGALKPEDSLVVFDILNADTMADANRSEDRSIEVLHKLIDGKIATGAKILPSVIGRGGTSSSASAEAMLYIKSISSIQMELNTLFSRMLTLALRLMGMRATAVFKFQEVNLRPELELASFRAVEQSSVLERLSLGMESDVEACIKLTGTLPPPGYKNLSGTMFKVAKQESGNSYSNTSVDPSGRPDSTQTEKNNDPGSAGVKSQ